MPDTPRTNPGVRFPPPAIYAIGFAFGWLLHLLRPLSITAGNSTSKNVLTDLCIVVWLFLMLGAFASFRNAKTSILPNRPAGAIVTSGPYRITRNPMYVSLVALYIALALVRNSWWPLMILPVVVLVIQQFVIVPEERYLLSAFPVEYGLYVKRVRRWL